MCKKLICLTSFVFVLLAVTSAANAQVGNLVLNPSFEEDEAILDDPAWEQWCTWNPAEGAGSNAAIVDTEAVDGTRSLRIDPVGPENWHFIVLSLPIPTEVGASYTACFWAKAAEPRPLAVQYKATDNTDSWGYTDFQLTTEWAEYSLTADALNAETKLEFFCAGVEVAFWLDFVNLYEGQYIPGIEPRIPVTIPVDPNIDLAAANELAHPGDTIEFASGTYNITSQIIVKDGVTYKGAGPGLTIIDGGNATRAFVAWGDRNATAGEVDANGVAVLNTTGPKDWVLEGLTIQNCVADADYRFSYAGVALDLLGTAEEDDSFADRDTDGSGGLSIDEADADNGDIRLPGLDGIEPSEDDDIHRFVEMDADGNGELSEAELDIAIAEKKEEFPDKRDDGNVLVIENGVVGTIQNCEFLNNTTSLDVEAADGGVLIINGQSTVITIANCKFEGNMSTDKGGAILVGVESEVILQDCDFKNNQTSDVGGNNHGGAILIWGQSKMTVNACRFEGNTAGAGQGGAIRISGESIVTITDCTLEGNSSDGHGGALFANEESVVTITGCELKSNHCGADGGAITLGGLSEVTVNDCFFNENYAASADAVQLEGFDGDGGHIKVQGDSDSASVPGTTLIANSCDFLGGKSEDDGGAIMSAAIGCVVRLDACWFEGNTAADDGTVLFTGNVNSNELTVTNCVFVNNISADASDKMCHVKRNSKFVNCTFAGNNQDDLAIIQNTANIIDADGDGVEDEMGDVTQVVNCIFANNVVGNGDDVLKSRNNNFTIAATKCLFFGNTLQNGNPADNTQRPGEETGSILTDPLLDALLVPGVGSPAIDAGIDPATVGVTITTDLGGNPRPQGAAYDVGAYEVAPTTE